MNLSDNLEVSGVYGKFENGMIIGVVELYDFISGIEKYARIGMLIENKDIDNEATIDSYEFKDEKIYEIKINANGDIQDADYYLLNMLRNEIVEFIQTTIDEYENYE
jgi:hypothetical protein